VILASATADIAPRSEGRLRAVLVRLGDAVVAGQPIAYVEMPNAPFDLAMAEAALSAAQVEQERTHIELAATGERLARRTRLSGEGLASREDLANARYQHDLARVQVDAANAQRREKQGRVDLLRKTIQDGEIRAPFSGVVAVRYSDPGANVTPATPIIRLVTAANLFVRFAIPDDARAATTVGSRVRVSAGAITALGVVDKVAPEVDPAARLVFVEARFDSTAELRGRLIAGDAVRVANAAEGP
jgi:RND family efflux transporter MFP subunit